MPPTHETQQYSDEALNTESQQDQNRVQTPSEEIPSQAEQQSVEEPEEQKEESIEKKEEVEAVQPTLGLSDDLMAQFLQKSEGRANQVTEDRDTTEL
jgi:DNA polymerase II small subunit/DNA polymerase delta subunit B